MLLNNDINHQASKKDYVRCSKCKRSIIIASMRWDDISLDLKNNIDPIRELIKCGNNETQLFFFDSILEFTVKRSVTITQPFLRQMEENGFVLQSIFNHIEDLPYNLNEGLLECERRKHAVPSFVNTTIQFRDLKFSPALENTGRTDREAEMAVQTESAQEPKHNINNQPMPSSSHTIKEAAPNGGNN